MADVRWTAFSSGSSRSLIAVPGGSRTRPDSVAVPRSFLFRLAGACECIRMAGALDDLEPVVRVAGAVVLRDDVQGRWYFFAQLDDPQPRHVAAVWRAAAAAAAEAAPGPLYRVLGTRPAPHLVTGGTPGEIARSLSLQLAPAGAHALG